MPELNTTTHGAATPAPGTRPAKPTASNGTPAGNGNDMIDRVSRLLNIPVSKPTAEPTAEEPETPEAEPEVVLEEPETPEEQPEVVEEPETPEAEPEVDPEQDDDPDAEEEEAEGAWTEAQQAAFDRRMKKEVKKRKEMEAGFKQQLGELQTEVEQLREGGGRGRSEAAPAVSNVMLIDDERTLAQHEAQLEEFQEWALQNWEGYEPQTEGEEAYSAADIQKRYRMVDKILTREIPKARQLMVQRRQINTRAAEIYPDLKNPKSEMNLRIDKFLRNMPTLKQFPDIRLMIAHILYRETELATKAKEKTPGAGSKPPKPAPKVPLKAAPAAKPAVVPTKKVAGKGPDIKTFIGMGGGRDALVAAVRGAIGNT